MLLSINISEQATKMKDTKTGRFKMILSPQYCKWMRVLTNLYRRFTCPQPQVANFCGFDYKCLWNTSKCQILFLFVGKYFLYFLNVTDSSNINMNSAFQSLSHVWLFATPWTTARQAFLSITNSQSLLKLKSIEAVMPSNHFILCRPLLFLPSIFPSIRVFSNESALHTSWLESTGLLELQLQHQSFQWILRIDFLYDWLVWSCSPRDSQESCQTPQFKSINSPALSLLYGPILTSIRDYWKNHSFDYMDFCW